MSSISVTKHTKKPITKVIGFFERCLPLRARDVAVGSDVHCVSDVSPCGEVGKHHITLRQRHNTSLWRSHNITAQRRDITI